MKISKKKGERNQERHGQEAKLAFKVKQETTQDYNMSTLYKA